MPYDEKGQWYGTTGQLAPGGTLPAGLDPMEIYKQLQALRSDQAANGGKYNGIQAWNVRDTPEFQKLDPATQEKVLAAQKQHIETMPKDNGWGAFLSALSLAAPVAMGVPGALSGGDAGAWESAFNGMNVPGAGSATEGLGAAAGGASGALGAGSAAAEEAALTGSGLGGLSGGTATGLGAAAGASLLDKLSGFGNDAVDLGKKLLSGDSSALDSLLKIGVPIATIAGLFEGNNNPLLEPMTNAAQKAIGAADQYAALPALTITPGQQQSIDLAKSNVGNYQPYLDKASTLIDKGTSGIQEADINRLMNPYLDQVLAPVLRDINAAADRRSQQEKALASMSGNDLRDPNGIPTRFNVQQSLLDQDTLRAIGDASANARSSAFDKASSLAGSDLDRSLSGSNLAGGVAKAAGALGTGDVTNLASAGALEAIPQTGALDKASNNAKLYTDVVHGNQGAVQNAAQPSKLTETVGALGGLKTAVDLFNN